MRGLQKVGNVWHIDKVVKGYRIKMSTETGDYKIACQILKDEIEKASKEANVQAKRGEARRFSYCATLVPGWDTAATADDIKQKVALLTEMLGDPDVRDISVEQLEDVRKRLAEGYGMDPKKKATRRAPRTVTKYMNTITTVLKNEQRLGTMNQYPTVKKLRVADTIKRALRPEEIQSLLAFFEEKDPLFKDACVVLLETGFRTGELSQLHARHVDFFHNSIHTKDMIVKYGRQRTIDMTPNVRAIIQRRIEEAGGGDCKIFPYSRDYHYLRRWNRWRKTQGNQKDLTPHSLRHTCCTMLLAAGNSIDVVRRWMGHRSITTTQGYLSLVPGQMQEAGAKLASMMEILTAKSGGDSGEKAPEAASKRSNERTGGGKVVKLFARNNNILNSNKQQKCS